MVKLKKGNMVMVNRDIYEAMTTAYHKVKAERETNMALANKLKKDLSLLDAELIKIGSKTTELLTSIVSLEESMQHIDDYALKTRLSEKMGYAMYMIDGVQGKIHKLREVMETIKRDVKPWEDTVRLENVFEGV